MKRMIALVIVCCLLTGTGTTGTYTTDGNDLKLTMGPLAEKATLNGDKLAMASQTFTRH